MSVLVYLCLLTLLCHWLLSKTSGVCRTLYFLGKCVAHGHEASVWALS